MKNDDAPDAGREVALRSLSAPMPLAQAARSLELISRPFFGGLKCEDLMTELERSFESSADSELMLYTHARLLDALFKRVLAHDMHSAYKDAQNIPLLKTDILDLALRMQKQCRMAISMLEAERNKAKAEE